MITGPVQRPLPLRVRLLRHFVAAFLDVWTRAVAGACYFIQFFFRSKKARVSRKSGAICTPYALRTVQLNLNHVDTESVPFLLRTSFVHHMKQNFIYFFRAVVGLHLHLPGIFDTSS